MKKLILLSRLCFLLMFFAACKKEDNYSKSVIGIWELKRSQSSFFNTTYSKGNGNILKYTASTYQIYKNHVLLKSGSYTLIPDTTVQESVGLILSNKEYKNRIVFDGKDDPTKTFIKISDNELSLVSGSFPSDGGSLSIYSRQ